MTLRVALAACVLVTGCVSAQSSAPPAAQQPAATFDGDRAFEHLKQIVAIGPRPAGSEGAKKTRDYIRQQISALGLTVTEQAFEANTPIGKVPMVNVSVRLPGAGGSPAAASGQRRLIIGGHYDTKLFKEFTFVGANDAGSSTAFLIELARVLKDRKNAVPIELLFLDGEEAYGPDWDTGNTWGSRHYVDAARRDGTLKQIGAFVLVDMIAEKDAVFQREENSTPWLADIVWSAARQLNRPEFAAEPTGPISDDHLNFLAAGIPSVDIIDIEYLEWHEAGDTLDKCSPQSLQAVGDVLVASLPAIELRLR